MFDIDINKLSDSTQNTPQKAMEKLTIEQLDKLNDNY